MAVLISRLVLPCQKLIASFSWNSVSLGVKAVSMALTIAVFPCHAALADESLEDGIKAAYLYKFSSYVDWPATAFTSTTSPFTVCLLGSSDHFNSTLRKIVQEESVNGRKIVVNEIRTLEREAGCHILYIGTTDPQRSAAFIDSVRGSNVLTVSDNASQGIIGFTITNNRLRFNIDAVAAGENGLVISSRLLSLAVNVKRRE